MINEWLGCEIIGTYAIETRELTKRFVLDRGFLDVIRNTGKRDVLTTLDCVNIKVRKGEVLGLLGPNGAGKSTLIKILCTLILPSEGNAYVNGYDVVKKGQKARSSIGFVTTDERSFYWRLSGRENLQFFATLHNLPKTQAKARIDELLDVVQLKNRADEPFLNYSAGMKQRMAIARGLLNDPVVLFMDEPTRSLDPAAAKNLRGFIKEHIVRERGKTVFISTHQLDEAEQLCDQVAILDGGRIKVQGSPAELKASLSEDSSLCDVFSFYTGKAFVEESASPAPFTIRRERRRGRGLGMKRKGF
ncbi:MAG: ABC transporter ATP-binding protein [Methanothrix sp.]|jgi:ABC-2 type transport system ATP-binding protein|nr:ABC transporter ATP-binding protein [Methanothrix sp.]